MELSNKILSDITVYMKYARYDNNLLRRESWEEVVKRNEDMHIRKYPLLEKEIREAYALVYDKKCLPSMRSLQFGGKAIELNHSRLFNCSYLPIDHPLAFSETMFLLLGGTGVGYSVQQHHIEKLPEIRKASKSRRRRFLIQDSIIGWADSIKVLMKSYFSGGSWIDFDYSDIRPKGSPLKTAGGTAPGPEPLKKCIRNIKAILNEKEDGTFLTSLEVHDIICHIADAVLAGGIRRAALISLFSADDEEMIACKYGNWWEMNPQRGRANNSAVFVRHKITKQFFLDLWKKIEISKSGEPGLYFTNDKDWGANPSLRRGTKVMTTEGVFPIESLQDKDFFVKNLNGEISAARCWLSGKDKVLYKLELVGGHSYYATAEHEWPIWDGEKYIKVKTPDIKNGMKLPVLRQDKLFDGNVGTYEDGFAIGWQLGDGWLSIRGDSGQIQHGFVVSTKDNRSNIVERLEKYLQENGSNAKFSLRSNSTYELNTINNNLSANLERFGVSHKSNGLPAAVWRNGSEDFRKGLVDALFSTDGYIEKNKKRIGFTSKHEKLVYDLSELLGFYGIKNSIKRTTRKQKLREHLEEKEYVRYDLRITDGASIRHFRNLFTISVKEKQNRLDEYDFPYFLENNQIGVVSVEKTDLKEDVWDISVYDETHCFQIAQCITGNCCEISLRPNSFCNLTEINASDIDSQEDLNLRARMAARIATLQAGYTDFHYLRPIWKKNTERDALLGVSMTGIASGNAERLDLQQASKVIREENLEIAKKIGIKPAARTTCVKPAGTSSLVLGCSSGIHAWHNDFYIRRIRVLKDEAIYKYLSEYHPELVEDDLLLPNTACIKVPQKAPDGSVLRSESVLNLLERIKHFSKEWVKPGHFSGSNTHNISATVSVKDEEWDIVGEWMWTNRSFYNGLSILPFSDHSYSQPPFEDCTKEEYEQMLKHLKSVDLTQIIEIGDDTKLSGELACAGGACEIT